MAIKKPSTTTYYIDGDEFTVFTFRKPVLCNRCDLSRNQCSALLMPCRNHDTCRSVLKRKSQTKLI